MRQPHDVIKTFSHASSPGPDIAAALRARGYLPEKGYREDELRTGLSIAALLRNGQIVYYHPKRTT